MPVRLVKILLLIIFCSLFLAGCTKNNEAVDDFELKMDSTQDSKPGFIIKLVTYLPDGDKAEFITYKKGNMWKDIEFEDGIIQEASMFNGKETFVLTDNNKYIKANLPSSRFSGIFNWNTARDTTVNQKNIYKCKHLKKQTEMFNGIKCRMVTYHYKSGVNMDACINEDTGIAIYHKEYGKVLPEFKGIYTTVKEIEVKNLSDNEFIPKF